jgi:hypothetical protein
MIVTRRLSFAVPVFFIALAAMADNNHVPDFFEPKPLPSAQDLASEGYPEIWATLTINTVIGLALYLLFEATRNKRSVHGRRLDRTRCVCCLKKKNANAAGHIIRSVLC